MFKKLLNLVLAGLVLYGVYYLGRNVLEPMIKNKQTAGENAYPGEYDGDE